jgi:hypothetical protein
VPAGLDEAELRAVRARFLAAQGWADEEEARAGMAARDARLARATAGAEELVLWFESDLYDMLQLAQVLDRLPPGRAAALVIVGETEFAGVGEVEAAALGSLLADARETSGGERTPLRPLPLVRREAAASGRWLTVDAALAEAGRAVWAAFRDPEPTALERVTDTPALPALGEAVRRHQQQFPWRGSNLSRTERVLLEAIRDGAHTPVHAFLAQQRAEERPFLGDTGAFAYLDALAGAPDPLVQNHGGLRLTERGRAVLDGGAEWMGRPERWLGGVQLPAGTPSWRWDPEAGRIV